MSTICPARGSHFVANLNSASLALVVDSGNTDICLYQHFSKVMVLFSNHSFHSWSADLDTDAATCVMSLVVLQFAAPIARFTVSTFGCIRDAAVGRKNTGELDLNLAVADCVANNHVVVDDDF